MLDVVGYRRLGHNEQDNPALTQPALYQAIAAHPSVLERYSRKLTGEGTLTTAEVASVVALVDSALEQGLADSANHEATKQDWLAKSWQGSALNVLGDLTAHDEEDGINGCNGIGVNEGVGGASAALEDAAAAVVAAAGDESWHSPYGDSSETDMDFGDIEPAPVALNPETGVQAAVLLEVCGWGSGRGYQVWCCDGARPVVACFCCGYSCGPHVLLMSPLFFPHPLSCVLVISLDSAPSLLCTRRWVTG